MSSEAWRFPACPVCGKQAGGAYRPFCSKRCADVDLHRWLAGAYALPAEEEKPSDAFSARGERESPNEEEEPL